MARYEWLWSRGYEADWRTAEIFMSIAKNPDMRELSLFLLKQIGRLTMADARFREFTGGIFSGVVSQSAWLVPRALYHAFPKDISTWMHLLRSNGREIDAGAAAGGVRLAYGTLASAMSTGLSLARNPVRNLDWSMDLAAKAAWIVQRRMAGEARP
jgi:hypothetical protein